MFLGCVFTKLAYQYYSSLQICHLFGDIALGEVFGT